MKHLMEAAVIDGMRDYLKRPEVYYALAMQDYNADRGSSTRSKEEIEKQVRQASKERAHYDEQATEFGLTQCQREIARKKSEQLERRLAELNAELRRASAVVPLPSESASPPRSGELLAILDRLKTFEEKREFVEAAIQRVLADGRQVKVTGTFDVQAVANKGTKGGIYSMADLAAYLGQDGTRNEGLEVKKVDEGSGDLDEATRNADHQGIERGDIEGPKAEGEREGGKDEEAQAGTGIGAGGHCSEAALRRGDRRGPGARSTGPHRGLPWQRRSPR